MTAPQSVAEPLAAEPTTTEPSTADTVDPVEDAVRVPCMVDRFRALFDRGTGALAVLDDDGRPIASAAPPLTSSSTRFCRGDSADRKPYSDKGLQAPVYESGGVSCSTVRGVDLGIHPLVSGTTGRQTGAQLIVSVRGRPTVLVSGLLLEELTGRRFSYSSKHCTLL